MNKYTATVFLGFGSTSCEFQTIKSARKWAEEFGDTADKCNIYTGNHTDGTEKLVAIHERKGRRWVRATV